MPTAAQLHSWCGGPVSGSAPLLGSALVSATAPPELQHSAGVVEVRCTVQFEYAAPALRALFSTPTQSTVQLVAATPSSFSSSSDRASKAGLWLQPAGHTPRTPSVTNGGDVRSLQPPVRDGHCSPSSPHSGRQLVLSSTARPSAVRAVRRQTHAEPPLQQQPTEPSFWLPLSAITALHWYTRDEDTRAAPSRGSTTSSSSSRSSPSAPRVVVVLQCAGDRLGHGARALRVVRLDGLRYRDALVLADAYDTAAESAPMPTNNAAMVCRPEGQLVHGHYSPHVTATAHFGGGKQVGVALIDAFPSPLAIQVDPMERAPRPTSAACASPAVPLVHDRCNDLGVLAKGQTKSAAYTTYARLLGGQATTANTAPTYSTLLHVVGGTSGNHGDDDNDDDRRPTRNHTAPQSPTGNAAADHVFPSVASFADSTGTLQDSSQTTSALYSPLGIARQESSSAAWSSQPHLSPEDDRFPSGTPAAPATWPSTAHMRAGRPFAADESGQHVPRWFPPPPDNLSDVSETTVGSSRGTTPVGEPSALPAAPLHLDPAKRHFLTPHSRPTGATSSQTPVFSSTTSAVMMAAPGAPSAVTTQSAAYGPQPGALQWPHQQQQQQQQQQQKKNASPPPPQPPVSQDRVKGSLQCLTKEQRELVNFERLLRTTIPPPPDAAPRAFPSQTPGFSSGAPQPAPPSHAAIEQALLRLRSYSLARHSLAPADEVSSPLTSARAAQTSSLSLSGNDADDVISHFTLAAPVAYNSSAASMVPPQFQATVPLLPPRGMAQLNAGNASTSAADTAPPAGATAAGPVPHREHGPFAQPRQNPTAPFLAQGGLRAPTALARPVRRGTVPAVTHPLLSAGVGSAVAAAALPSPQKEERDGARDRDAAADGQHSGSSAGSGDLAPAAVTARQGRSGSLRTRRGSGTRPPLTPPQMLPRRPNPAKGPQSFALDSGALLVRTLSDEEESVPSPTAMAT